MTSRLTPERARRRDEVVARSRQGSVRIERRLRMVQLLRRLC
ncbi:MULTISPECIES: hypothetical protein [unclassified Nocardioides]|nr:MULTISPECIES: hypothetical protein [unclassified Nocardioides]